MNCKFLYLISTTFLSACIFIPHLYCQSQTYSSLDFNKQVNFPMNVISIELKNNQVYRLHQSLNLDGNLKFKNVHIDVSQLNTDHASIKVRGQSSKAYRRKSLSVHLPDKASFYDFPDTFRLKKFYAISLSMDKDYVRNAIAFSVLSEWNLCVPSHCFATINLNDSSEGIYMIFYPPQEYAVKQNGASFVIRRRYFENGETKETDHLSSRQVSALRKKFTGIYSTLLRKYSGRQLYDSLEARLDMKQYFDWLVFNYIFCNGDYTDEVFFYWDPSGKIYRIIPWDFDDLFMEYPHEGNIFRDKKLRDKLLFSLEDKLDETIAGDPVLYGHYLDEFDLILKSFDSEKLRDIFQKVYNELLPYYLRPEIIRQSKYDKYRLTNLALLKADLEEIFQNTSQRIILTGEMVDAQRKSTGR